MWSVWIAQPLANHFGVKTESIESLSWDRWQIKGLSFDQESIQLQAETIELPSPTKLVFEHFSSDLASQSLQLQNWSLDIISSTPPPEEQAGSTPTLGDIIDLTNDSLAQLGNYLSSVELKEGTISLDATKTVAIPLLELSPDSLHAEVDYLPKSIAADLDIDFSEADRWKLSSRVPQYEIALASELTAVQNEARLSGTLSSSQNQVTLTASWLESFIPATARIETDSFTLDQRYPFWGDAPVLEIASIANWAEQAFDYRIEGFDTAPRSSQPIILLEGQGSQTNLQIETANVNFPWLSVESDKTILIDFSLDNPLEAAELEAKLNLEKVPFIEATGKLDATLRTKTSEAGIPTIAATLRGSNISLWDSALETVSAAIDLEGRDAHIHSLDILSTQGSVISLKGSFNIDERRLAPSTLSLNLVNESQRLRDLMPEFDWQTIKGELQVEGPIEDAQFAGELTLDNIKFPQTNSFSLDAQIHGKLSEFSAEVHARNEVETLNLAIDASRTDTQNQFTLRQLALAKLDGTSVITLEEPGLITLELQSSDIATSGIVLGGPDGKQLALESFALSESQLELHASAIDFDTDVFNNWLNTPIPTLRILDFDTNAILGEELSQITTSGSASWNLNETSSVDISWLAKSDPTERDNLNIDHLEVGANAKHILVAEGQFPISIYWAQKSLTSKIHSDAPIAFSLESSPHPAFWASLESIFPIAIKRPVIKAKLSGTLEKPSGNFDLQLASLDWTDPADPNKTLRIQDFKSQLSADSDSITITSLEAFTGKNSLKASASLPLGSVSLIDLVKNSQTLDFAPLTGNAHAELTDFEAIKAWLPEMMRYSGSALVDFEIDSGDITATAQIDKLATRPMPPLGALSQISGRLTLRDGIWQAEEITGLAEKSPFTLAGSADLNDGENPLFDLRFVSKEFPLLRDDGLLISGDIDINLVSTDQGQPMIRGELILKKGLALVEPDLLASSTRTVSSRPPYFAVEQAPFDEWGLEISIRGDQFLRVSNSYFQGTLSAEFDLEGNLGTPLLIGKAETYGGRIFFPASSLRLKTGQAFITRDQPSTLQIEALAEGRLFAYDINLDVTGTADNPELIITSNPALTQVEALLLLTTGAVPNDGGNLAQQSATSLGVFIGKGLFKKLTGGNSDSASKLNLEIGQDLSRQGKKTIEATYQLSEDLEIEGEYDKRDEFNANLKWTILKR